METTSTATSSVLTDVAHTELLALIEPDPEDPQNTQAQTVVGLLLEHAAQLQELNSKHSLDDRLRTLEEQRTNCLQRLEGLNDAQQQLDLLWNELRPLSQQAQRVHRVTQQDGDYAQCLQEALASNWVILQDLVLSHKEVSLTLVGPEDVSGSQLQQRKLLRLTKWRETYLDNVLGLSVLEGADAVQDEDDTMASSSSTLGVADMAKQLYQSGKRNARRSEARKAGGTENMIETCDTCGWIIQISDPRYRCIPCQEVQCQSCFTCFGTVFHSHDNHNRNLEMVLEHRPASMIRAKVVLRQNPADALYTTLVQWADRPCFCKFPSNGSSQEWMTYNNVLHEAQKRITKLVELQDDRDDKLVALLFPAASLDFYLWDMACILCGITTIGIPATPPPEVEDWPVSRISHVVCSSQTRDEHADRIPDTLIWVDASSADDLPPCDAEQLKQSFASQDMEGHVTVYLTSGTTGKPKLIPETRRTFWNDRFAKFSFHTKPLCTVSFLPPCWSTDRDTVYWAVAEGHRVGFAPPNPSLPHIVQAMEVYQPTSMALPPTVAQFVCSLKTKDGTAATDLGGKLEYVTVGGAPVSKGTLQELRQLHGIAQVQEGYGSTEAGGIASAGWFLEGVKHKVRIRNPDNGDWLDRTQEGVTGELWIGDINTCDMVELTNEGRQVKVLGRSADAASYKLSNGKWAALVDIEDQVTRTCCPELLDEVLVWVNCHGVLVLLGVRAPSRWEATDEENDCDRILSEVIQRSNLAPELQPTAMLLTKDPLPKTVTHKIQRGKVVEQYREEANALETIRGLQLQTPLNAADLAAMVLGKDVDLSKTFVENGGTSMDVVRWLKEMETQFGQVSDWRALLDHPLGGPATSDDKDADVILIDPPPAVEATADSILLTGATGFFGRHVLQQLLAKEKDVVVVCLVRDTSKALVEESDHVLVVTSVPTGRKYKSVIHLAANVNHVLGYKDLKADNVDLTEHLLRLRLAPVKFCSTMSTQKGSPPFADGYTQSKWVSEQMVLRSGGSAFWPPLLVFGNQNDWLTRLLQHCLRTKTYPSSLGFVLVCPVEVAARDLLEGQPCSVWDLDLKELFVRLRSVVQPLQAVPMSVFLLGLQHDKESPAHAILPLLQGTQMVGSRRHESFELLSVDATQILDLIAEIAF